MAKYDGKRSRLLNPETQEQKKVKSGGTAIDTDKYLKRIRRSDLSRRFGNLFNFNFNLRIPSFLPVSGSWRTIIIGAGTGLIIAFFVILITDFYRVRALANFQPNVTTKIYDKNDILVSELFRQKREVVSLEKMPPDLINAIISIEDNEFYDHFGINIKGIVRAFFVNVFAGRIRQGGSTITQQLAKVLMTSGERNIYRKIKEAFIALMMEAGYSKDEIISLYLNQIFFGHGAYGVESASLLYFKKHVWELSLAESALLASLPSAPNRYSPIRNPKLAMSRHKMVLAKMAELGFTTVGEAEKAYLTFWPDYLDYISGISPSDNTWSTRTDKAPWFTEYIRRHLVKTYGEEMVFEQGLAVYTTLDVNKQLAAQNQVQRHLAKQISTSSSLSFDNDEYIIDNYTDSVNLISVLFDVPDFRKKGSRENETINKQFQQLLAEELEAINLLAGLDTIDRFFDAYKLSYLDNREFQKVEGCLISINPTNGYIEALVGGSEFTSINQLIRPFQSLRQPGSAIKPLIYAAAIESGEFTPSTTVLDSPIVYLDNEGGDWIPENYERDFHGFMRLRRALALSVNVVSIRIADKLGIEYLMRYIAKLLRFDPDTAKRRIPRNFSIALGSMEVTPFELTRAYAIIANGGKDVIPYSIRYVKDREGTILENTEADTKALIEKSAKDGSLQIIKPETAQVMISMMRSVISEGTGGSASPGRPAGGKTGTTNNFKDAWFIGFTPQLATGVWIGYDKLGLSLGSGQSGGGISAPMWGAYMREAMKHEPVLEFPSYAPLAERTVCRKSGMLPSPQCADTMNEIFIPSALPDKECDLCPGISERGPSSTVIPKENVSGRQGDSILQNLKETNDSIFNDSIDDLLDKKQ